MKIKLERIMEAIETADDAFTYLYDTQTGETVLLPDDIAFGERDEELEELIENAPMGRFLRFPTKYDIHEYSIMEGFVYSLPFGAARQELVNAIAAEVRSDASKMGFVTIVWNNSGTTTGIRNIGKLPYAGVRSRSLNTRKKPDKGARLSCSHAPLNL